MIVYELCCKNNHKFEGWFPSRESFEEQLKSSLILCPICNSSNIKKVPSAFFPKTCCQKAISSQKNNNETDQNVIKEKVYNLILQHTEDVSANFAEEALKIHYGLSPEKNIRGIATEKQEKTLKDEGINFFKLSVLSNKKNNLN
jgi:hypothetical protein